MDIAVRDSRAVSGWVFGTHMYNGKHNADNGWYRLVPVGLMWGNDPEVNQVAYEAGERPKESWFNPEGSNLVESMHGSRPWWGWNERMNGPADGFISACISCHSTSEWPHKGVDLFPKKYVHQEKDGRWVPNTDEDGNSMDPQVMK
ncbi:hypothetical protein M422DRAFT_56937 [Sphaerobolus stellatus SS14]|uniref:Uncharacterized protein n=1 Tax=Sphaerobolus stellatus (strain SS14) TaxID=990650 RepID=A0A0C9TMU4_SPHS4|nr:hypothetical protein M422DRAFT_56937 [Sphaerobolus stellatus SS14]